MQLSVNFKNSYQAERQSRKLQPNQKNLKNIPRTVQVFYVFKLESDSPM